MAKITNKVANQVKLMKVAGKQARKWERNKGLKEILLKKEDTKQLRKSEYYATKRAKYRAHSAAAAVTASEDSRQKTKRIEAEQATERIRAQVQYNNLINGEQGTTNPLNDEDVSASKGKSSAYTSNEGWY